MARRWPTCLKAVPAVALLIKDADKLTLGQQITVEAPHSLESTICQPTDLWMANAWMIHYQSLLLTELVMFAPPVILNPTCKVIYMTSRGQVFQTCTQTEAVS